MIEPTEEEWRDAERRRSNQVQSVFGEYQVIDGRILAASEDEVRWYFPLAARSIARDLARVSVGSEEEALGFTARWGLLGFTRLASRMQPEGDPIAWTWAHARNFQIAMRLRSLRGDDEALADYLSSIRAVRNASYLVLKANELLADGDLSALQRATPALFESGPPQKLFRYVFAKSDKIGGIGLPGRYTPSQVASALLRSIINPHVRGVYEQIETSGQTTTWGRSFDAVINAAYRRLAEIVIAEQSRECQFCDALFTPTDRRQRFCPREPWREPPGESTCALNYRTRKLRGR